MFFCCTCSTKHNSVVTKPFLFSCVAIQVTPVKGEPPTILPQGKGTYQPTNASESKKVAPPEPKKRTNRRASISILEKDVESLHELKQSRLREAKEELKDVQSAMCRSIEKESDVVQNVTQLEKHKDKDSEVSKEGEKIVRVLEKKAGVDMGREEPPRSLETEKEFQEMTQSGSKLGKLVRVDQNVSQSDKVLGDSAFEQRRRPLICLAQENDDEQMSNQAGRSLENKVDTKEKLPGTILQKNREEEKPVKVPERSVKDILKEQEENSTIKEAEVEKTDQEPLKPPLRSKGKEPLKNVPKETIIFQSVIPTVDDSVDDQKQRAPVKQLVSIDADREKQPAGKQSVEQPEKMEKGVEFAPPKPPKRVKSKSKGGVEKQFSRDTETDQDDQQMTRVALRTTDDQPIKQPAEALGKEAEEKTSSERKESVRTDTEIAGNGKEPVRASEKNVQQPVKQPVRPMRKEPEQEMKVAVEPMRREREQLVTKMAGDVPLLYISEDETFLEALTDIPTAHSKDQPAGSFVEGSVEPHPAPPVGVFQRAEPPTDATPEMDISTENEPQLQDAAVKIQAAFKGYKTRKDMRPVFKEVFKNQSVDLHSTLTLVCSIEGNASTVRWLKNGQQMSNDHRCHIKTAESGMCTLVIKNLTPNDSGIYTCEAVNKFGVTSYNGNITVAQPQKLAHPPFAAVTPLQLAAPKPDAEAKTQNVPQTQTQIPTSATDATSYVESVNVSLWEAYNLTEQQDALMSLQERRGSSIVAASSSE